MLVCDAGRAELLRERRMLGFRAGARRRTPTSAAELRGVVGSGFRYHLSNINAAIGLAQFSRLTELLEGRRAVARLYDGLLGHRNDLRTFRRDYSAVVPFIYPVLVPPQERDALLARFAAAGIHADLRYSLCHQEPLFGSAATLGVAEQIADSLVCLPIYAGLAESQVREVVSVLIAGLSSSTRADAIAHA